MKSGLTTPRPAVRWINFLIWGLIALAYLVYFFADVRLDFDQLQVPCSGELCNYLALSPAEIEVLRSWGLSGRAYALIMTSASLFTMALYWTLSAMILWRSGNSRIGWTISLTLIVVPATVVADADNVVTFFPQWEFVSYFLASAGIGVLFLFWYLIPNGQFYPRWAFVPMSVTILVGTFFYFIFNGLFQLPAGLEWIANWVTLFALILLAPVLQFFRYRRHSLPVERQQTKWIFFGLVPFLLAFLVAYLIFIDALKIPPGQPRLLAVIGGWLLFLILVCMLPVALSISILRYRLWDIDLLIRRTLQYAMLTGILALLYFFGVILLQPAALALFGQADSPIFIVVTTLAIAAMFNPLRKQVQGFIDRRFYRARYDTERTLAEFAATARDEVDLQRLTGELLQVIENTLQPSKAILWILKNPHRAP